MKARCALTSLVFRLPLWALCMGAGCDAMSTQPSLPDGGGGGPDGGGMPAQGLKLQGISLQGISLQGISLQGISLQGISLQGTALRGMSLVGTTLRGMRLTPPKGQTPSLSPCATTARGAARDCGLSFGGLGTCGEGSQVTLSTAAACGLGSCATDSVLRVCAGGTPCEHGTAAVLGEGESGCGTSCAALSFRCPPGGMYTVLQGGQSSDTASPISAAASAGAFPLEQPVSGKELIGARLAGIDARGNPVPLLISDIENDPTDPQGEVLLYSLLYQDPKSQAIINPCAADPDGARKAIPVSGVWDGTGAHAGSQDFFTLACTSGVIAKCVRWGYKPWKTVMGQPLAEVHQTCTRMARADYCGDGVTHTHDGTPIDEYDVLGLQREVPSDGMLFEGHWNADGAYCLSKERWFNVDLLDPQVLLGNALLTECPARISLPGPDDQFGGKICFRKLSNQARASIRTSNNSYLLQVNGNL